MTKTMLLILLFVLLLCATPAYTDDSWMNTLWVNSWTGEAYFNGAVMEDVNPYGFLWDYGDGNLTTDWFPQYYTYSDLKLVYTASVSYYDLSNVLQTMTDDVAFDLTRPISITDYSGSNDGNTATLNINVSGLNEVEWVQIVDIERKEATDYHTGFSFSDGILTFNFDPYIFSAEQEWEVFVVNTNSQAASIEVQMPWLTAWNDGNGNWSDEKWTNDVPQKGYTAVLKADGTSIPVGTTVTLDEDTADIRELYIDAMTFDHQYIMMIS